MGYDLHQSATPQINETTCNGCGQCVAVCPSQTLALENGRVNIATRMFLGCIGCGQCTMVCPTESIVVRGRRFGPEDLVNLPPEDQRATAEQLDALLLSRRSVRRFRDKEVERSVVDQIVAMTSTAPIGIPPSEVGITVFHGREKVRQFTADSMAAFRAMQWFFHPVSLALMRPIFGKEGYRLMRDFVRPLIRFLLESWDRGEDAYAYDAPLAMLFHVDPQSDLTDCTIAATHAMLAAHSFGLGSCMLGTCTALGQAKPFKAKYGIPPRNKVGLGLVIGYPAATFRRSVRRKLASVTFA